MIESSAVDFSKKRFIRNEPNPIIPEFEYDGVDTPMGHFVRANSEVYRAFDRVEDFSHYEPVGKRGRKKRLKAKKRYDAPAETETYEYTHSESQVVTVSRIKRERSVVEELKELYRHRCQICGKGARTPLKELGLYVEGHHIKPLGSPHNGPDIKENILIVCPTHHVEMQYGGIALVRTELAFNWHKLHEDFIEYHNVEISCV